MVGEDRPASPPDPESPSGVASSSGDGADEALPAGTLLGKYDVIEVLGQGGFGITYRARDARLDRDVAIKEYLPTSFARRHGSTTVLPRSTRTAEDFLWGRERFLDEAKTLARLENTAGIVNVYDYLEANGTAYMVMALVRGETLEARLKRSGRLPQPAIELFFYPLLDGLERVHQVGFLHRDIKPANILLDPEGRPTLIDFGASRLALQGRTKAMTAVYTPGYAAYEQATSAAQGPWTDIYALAATLYHCIIGAPPPSALERMAQDTLVPASEAGHGRYAPSLLAAIDAGLALKAADRPQSIADWRRVMAGQPITAPTDAMTRRMDEALTVAPAVAATAPPRRRSARLGWVAAGVVAVLAAAGGWAAIESHRRAEAETARKVAEEKAAAEAVARKAADDKAAEEKARADAEMRRRAEAAENALRLSERDRYQVRLALTSLGFDAGSGDGAFGTRSRPMIAAWQKSRGFPDTGYLTGPQLAALREQAAEALARDDERLRRQEESKRKAEQEAVARKAAEEKAAADAATRRKAEEDAKRKAEQETAARKAAEEKAAAEAAVRRRAEEEAKRKAEQEAAARKAAEEKAAADAAARKAAEDKAAAEAAAREKAQEAARRAAAEESGRRAEELARAETARRQAAEEKAAAEAAARRKADEGAKSPSAATTGNDLLADWARFQGCLVSSGGWIGRTDERSFVVARKVCWSAAAGAGRYEVTLENGMVCSGTARKTTEPVGFTVDRQTCTAPTSGTFFLKSIVNFEAPCTRGTTGDSLLCRTNYSNATTGGPYVFRRQ